MPGATPVNSPSRELTELGKLALDIRALLASQKELLTRAGLSTPPGVMDGLSSLGNSLGRIQKIVAEQDRERAQLAALADVGRVINSSLDLTTVLNEVMDTIIRLTGAERGFLMLKNANGELDFRVARGMDREALGGRAFEISRTIVENVARTGEAVVTTNAQEDPRFQSSESVIGYNLRSILCSPLKVKGELTGVICADNRVRTGLFTDRDRDLLAAFANQAAVAIENARLFETVKATLAEVTQIKNLMENVFASIASGVITTDVQNVITLCNRAAEHILGVNSRAVRGAPFEEGLPVLDTALGRVVDEVRTAERRVVAYEINPVMPERGRVNLSLNLTPLKDAEDQTQGVAIVVEDLTETKRLKNRYEIFQRMVSPAVIESLPNDPNELKLGGKRQEISTLFADIRGFTTFSEMLDPQELLEILNQYLGMAAEAVLLHEGTLDKFLGDAVMAIFNAPLPQPDHTLRAVRAAMGMRADIEAFRETVDPSRHLAYGIGINVGEAVVGMVGTRQRLDYSAIGDTVNLAKRIQENAKPDQILLSETAYSRVKDYVWVTPLEPIKVKGRQQPVPLYELTGIK
ncbi:MAG: GAF domain-containing protein [Chloroflexi bacterium]|nr:GAF domain-containing protein [Chloroflexota bacterium]